MTTDIEFDYRKVICQKSSLQRLHEQTQLLNQAVPSKIFTKVVNGEERQYERKPKAITGSVEATMERLIKNYVKYHHRLLRNVGDEAFEEGMPGMLTCRSEVAGQRTISEKTAYNHLRKLRELGLIKRYKFRGSRHAFEIWIDPVLLFQPERLATAYPQQAVNISNAAENQPRQTAFSLAIPADFTGYKVTVTSMNSETEKEADGNVHSDALQQQHGDENYGNPERQQPNLGQTLTVGSVGHSDSGTGGGAADPPAIVDNPTLDHEARMDRLRQGKRRKKRTLDRSAEQRRAILDGYLTSFWRYAQQMLYPGRPFADYEEPLILSAIRRGVYRDFEPILTEKEWDQYQTELYKQIDLAAGYYGRHPDRWVPAPYAQFREGAGYFDRENERGFSQTRAWLKENQRLYRGTYITQRISLAIRHLQLHRADKAPQSLQRKTYIEAYRLLETQIGRYGEVAQDRFRLLASTIGTQKPKLTPGFTKNFRN